MVRFTPQKPACHPNHRSTHANQTEARYRQPPRQMGMAPRVNRRRGADSPPESLTARKANPQGFHAPPRGKPCSSRHNFLPSTTAATDFSSSPPSGHSVNRGHHRVPHGNPTTHLLPPPVDIALQQTGSHASTLQQELCYMLIARRGATLATRSSPDPTSTKARSAGVKTTPLIVDSGATVSIVNDRKLLANIREIPPKIVGHGRSWAVRNRSFHPSSCPQPCVSWCHHQTSARILQKRAPPAGQLRRSPVAIRSRFLLASSSSSYKTRGINTPSRFLIRGHTPSFLAL